MSDELTPTFWVAIAVVGLAGVVGVIGTLLDRPEIWIPAFAVFFGVAAIKGAGRNLRAWRGETRESRMVRPPGWWVWSPGLWRANLRTTPIMAIGAAPMMGTALLILAVYELHWPARPDELAWIGALRAVTVLVWVGVVGLAVSVALFNQPKIVVPRHLRSHPGLLAGDNHDPEVGAEEHRTAEDLGLRGHFPEGRVGLDDEPERDPRDR